MMRDAFGHPQSVVVLGDLRNRRRAGRPARGRQVPKVVLAGRDSRPSSAAAQRAKAGGGGRRQDRRVRRPRPRPRGEVVSECLGAAGDTVDWVVLALGHLGDAAQDGTDAGECREHRRELRLARGGAGPVAQRLRAQGYGRIVVLSSVAGVRIVWRTSFTVRPRQDSTSSPGHGRVPGGIRRATARRQTGIRSHPG